MVYIDDQRVMMKYLFPLNEIVVDFYDHLKSLSSGYARYRSAALTSVNLSKSIQRWPKHTFLTCVCVCVDSTT